MEHLRRIAAKAFYIDIIQLYSIYQSNKVSKPCCPFPALQFLAEHNWEIAFLTSVLFFKCYQMQNMQFPTTCNKTYKSSNIKINPREGGRSGGRQYLFWITSYSSGQVHMSDWQVQNYRESKIRQGRQHRIFLNYFCSWLEEYSNWLHNSWKKNLPDKTSETDYFPQNTAYLLPPGFLVARRTSWVWRCLH